MTRSRCPIDDQTLSAYLDDELGRLERWRIARHLARCAQCRHRHDRLRRADAIALFSMTPADDVGFEWAEAGGEDAARRMDGRRRLDHERGRHRRRVVGIAAALLLGVVAAVHYTDPSARVSEALYRLHDRNADRVARLLAETRFLRETIATLRAELVSADVPAADRDLLEREIARCAEQLRHLRAAARGVDATEGGRR